VPEYWQRRSGDDGPSTRGGSHSANISLL